MSRDLSLCLWDTGSYKKTFRCLRKAPLLPGKVFWNHKLCRFSCMYGWARPKSINFSVWSSQSACYVQGISQRWLTHINFAFYGCDAAITNTSLSKAFPKNCSYYTTSQYDLPPWISSATVKWLMPVREKPDLLWFLFLSKLMFWVLLPKSNYWKLSFFLLYHYKNKSYNYKRLKTENHNYTFTNYSFHIILDNGKMF